jgi:hypothetical protein
MASQPGLTRDLCHEIEITRYKKIQKKNPQKNKIEIKNKLEDNCKFPHERWNWKKITLTKEQKKKRKEWVPN